MNQLGLVQDSNNNPLATQTITFDQVRQQPTVITLTNNSGTQLNLKYGYCPGAETSCSTNNGNILSAMIVAPLNVTQNFGYDKVNRLTSAQETGGTSEWNQTYTYDQWGNRAVSGNYIPNAYATPTALTQYTNNQWLATGASYDLAGNQTALTSRTFGYDGENRLIATTQPNMGAISYVYDGQGHRVQKTVGSNVTSYVYDASGQLAAEYNSDSPASGTQYLIADTLGSTRLTLDASGNPKEYIDYLPFGEELPNSIGGRGALYSAGIYPGNPDIESQKFTGKERDAESGLDYFEARYFSSSQGRFTSPDEFKGGGLFDPSTGLSAETIGPLPYADITDPQTLNKYAYVRNNPLRYVDPDGHCGLFGDNPCSSLGQFISVLPDRIVGGLKGEANAFGASFKPSNPEQAEVMNNVKAVEPVLQTAVAVALPGPEGEAGETLGDFHAPGDVPNGSVIVRGGQSEMPPAGEVFSGSQGANTAEAATGVPHGTIRETTAGAIRDSGGTVTVAPEATRAGNMNYQHVNVTEGAGKTTFGAPKPNPVPKKERIE